MNYNGGLDLCLFLEILLQVSMSSMFAISFCKLKEIGVLHVLAKLGIAPISIYKAGGNK